MTRRFLFLLVIISTLIGTAIVFGADYFKLSGVKRLDKDLYRTADGLYVETRVLLSLHLRRRCSPEVGVPGVDREQDHLGGRFDVSGGQDLEEVATIGHSVAGEGESCVRPLWEW